MTQPGSLSSFEAWLHQRRLAPENRIPYVVRWVERYRRFSTLRPSEAWQDTLGLKAIRMAIEPARNHLT